MNKAIIYYSLGGNTKGAAEKIQNITGADIFRINTLKPYTGSYNDIVEQGHKEVKSGFMPEIENLGIDLNKYEIIILGTPVWWYTLSPALKTFLNNNSMEGKTVYPFATNGGWIGHTFKDIENLCHGADVKKGLNLSFSGSKMTTPEKEIINWAQNIN